MIYYGKIYDYQSKEEAKALIGKKVICSDYLSVVKEERTSLCRTLVKVTDSDTMPFDMNNNLSYQFIREVTVDSEVEE